MRIPHTPSDRDIAPVPRHLRSESTPHGATLPPPPHWTEAMTSAARAVDALFRGSSTPITRRRADDPGKQGEPSDGCDLTPQRRG